MLTMKNKDENVYRPDLSTCRVQPFFIAKVAAGFPSPADDYQQASLDLNKHLVTNPAATYFVRVTGDSMVGAGIHSDDILVVDRSIEPRDGKVVVAAIDGELVVKRIRIKNRKVTLVSENANYKPQEVGENAEFNIWGVVTSVIHKV